MDRDAGQPDQLGNRAVAEGDDLAKGILAFVDERHDSGLPAQALVSRAGLSAGDARASIDRLVQAGTIVRVADLLADHGPRPVTARRKSEEEARLIIARAEADLSFRRAVLEDLEAALAEAGCQPAPPLVEALRRRFSSF